MNIEFFGDPIFSLAGGVLFEHFIPRYKTPFWGFDVIPKLGWVEPHRDLSYFSDAFRG